MQTIKEFLWLTYAFIWFILGGILCLLPFMLTAMPTWMQIAYCVSVPFQLAGYILWSRKMESMFKTLLVGG